MATYTSTSGSYTTTLTVTESATSTANNTSTVTFSLTLTKNSGTGLWNNDSCPWSININGTSYSGTFTYDFRSTTSITLKSNTTQTITHDSDGTKSISVSASVNMDNTPYVYTMSPSGTLTLTTIPRASDIALGVSSFSITSASGNAFSWSITAKSNSFYNRLRYSIGNKSNVSSNKGQGSSSGYFTNQELLSALPSSTSGSLTVYCDTYSDSGYSNLIGSKSVVITVSVNTSYIKPSVSLGNIGINSSPISGYAVAGYSKVQSSWSTSNSYGATSVTTYFTVSHGSLATTSSTSTSGTVVSNVIPSNSSNYTLTIYAYAKDSRGAVSATVSKAITVYGYQPPTANLTAYRTTSSTSTNEDGAGTYAYVTFSGAVRSSVNSQNSIQSTSCTYSGSISGTATNGGHYALSDTQSVTFKLTVTDKVTSSTASVTIATAQYPLDLYDDGSGNVGGGIGAVARSGEFNLGVRLSSATGKYQEIYCDINQSDLLAYDSTLDTAGNELDWLTVLLKVICANYPSRANTVFKGWYQKGARRFFNVFIYSTSALTDGIPQYAYGWVCLYSNYFRVFGSINYTPYYNYIDIADTATNATNATNTDHVRKINTNPTSITTYSVPFIATGSTGYNYAIRDNDGLTYLTSTGTTSQKGRSYLQLGNETPAGTAGNRAGIMRFCTDTQYVADLRAYPEPTAHHFSIYLPNSDGTLLTDTNTTERGIVTRSSGLTLSFSQAVSIGGSKLTQLNFVLTGSQDNAVGGNAFVGTLASGYRPLHEIEATCYYSTTLFVCHIYTNGNINVRTLIAARNIGSETINFTFTYLRA